jgi:hypothetical protein
VKKLAATLTRLTSLEHLVCQVPGIQSYHFSPLTNLRALDLFEQVDKLKEVEMLSVCSKLTRLYGGERESDGGASEKERERIRDRRDPKDRRREEKRREEKRRRRKKNRSSRKQRIKWTESDRSRFDISLAQSLLPLLRTVAEKLFVTALPQLPQLLSNLVELGDRTNPQIFLALR